MTQAVLEQRVKKLEDEVKNLRRLVLQILGNKGLITDEYQDDFARETLQASRQMKEGNFLTSRLFAC